MLFLPPLLSSWLHPDSCYHQILQAAPAMRIKISLDKTVFLRIWEKKESYFNIGYQY